MTLDQPAIAEQLPLFEDKRVLLNVSHRQVIGRAFSQRRIDASGVLISIAEKAIQITMAFRAGRSETG